MLRYLIKRLLLIIPSLGIMSLFVFYVAQFSQQDLLLQKEENSFRAVQNNTLQEWEASYAKAEQIGFHHPSFYFSIFRKSSSDTLNRIQDQNIRQNLKNLAYQIGDWEKVNRFYASIKTTLPTLTSEDQQALIQDLKNLNLTTPASGIFIQFPNLNSQFKSLQTTTTKLNNFIPIFKWNGFNNQHHQWLKNVLKGNFGKSLVDASSVNEKISNAIYWSLLLSIVSLLITFSIAITAAFYSSLNPNYYMINTMGKLFFLFYAIPNFWIGTLLIVFFTSGDYLDWFPTYGLGFVQDD